MFLAHLRYAVRLVRLRPASSAAVVLTLALAIAANSTLFTLIDSTLLAPLPVREPDRLVNVYTSRADGTGFGGLSYPDFLDLARSGPAIEGALGYSGLMVTATGEAGSEVVFGELVTANYFSLLGVQPMLGRGFRSVEGEERGAHPVVVIGHRYWKRRFGGDPSAVGRTVTLNGKPYTVVGVTPPEFTGLLVRAIAADVWVPASMMGQVRKDELDNRAERWMFMKARLVPGASAEQAAAAARVVAARLEQEYPATNKGRQFRVVPSSDVIFNPEGDGVVGAAASGVMLATGLVLLVACANLAGVMLARGLARRREISVRLAIGATRWQIVQQLLVESVVLSFLGSVVGLIVARWWAAALAAWRPDLPVPISLNTTTSWRVTLFTLALSVVATLLFALVPALRASRTPAAGTATIMAIRRRRWMGARDVLLVPQIAIALVLVTVAALFARSLSRAGAVDPGFEPERTAYVSVYLGMSGYDDARAAQFFDRLSRSLQSSGAVTHAALADRLPLDIYGNQTATVSAGAGDHAIQIAHVGAGYFETMGIRVARGRAFDAADERPGMAPAIVSDTATRLFWPGRDPICQSLRVADRTVTVVGVSADARVQTLGEAPQPFVYLPIQSDRAKLLRLVVRSNGDPAAAVAGLRRQVPAIDPAVAIFEARTMEDYLAVMLYPYRLAASIAAALGVFALALAGIGLYGVFACGVAERLRDLAIRIALGASAGTILRAAAADTLRATVVGTAIGALLALAAGRMLATVLFGISWADPIALGATAVALSMVIAAASAGPIRRALRVAPMSVLRL
jgi:predicted permease